MSGLFVGRCLASEVVPNQESKRFHAIDYSGVRPDIAFVLKANHPQEDQLRAALQLARNAQGVLALDPSDARESEDHAKRGLRALKCVRSVYPGPPKSLAYTDILKRVLGLTYDTPERAKIYFSYVERAKAAQLSLPKGNTCD